MTKNKRIDRVKDASKAVINMLNWADHVTVIGFSSIIKTMEVT